MQITLRLSRFNDLDLYAYFMGVEYRRSTLVKQLLRDYIRREHTVRLEAPNINAQTFTNPEIEKQITIPVTLGKSDEDIIQYLSDCPNRMRGKCVKSILRMMLAPYTQCAYHFSPITPYAPYCDRPPIAPAGTGIDITQLLALLLGQNLQQGQTFQMPVAKPQPLYPNPTEREFCQPVKLPQMPEAQSSDAGPFGRADNLPISPPISEYSAGDRGVDVQSEGACLPLEKQEETTETTNAGKQNENRLSEEQSGTSAPDTDTADVSGGEDALLQLFGVDY